MLTYILYGLFILSCFVLIVVILLQPGKSGAGDLFASSVSSTAFGPRGTQTLLAKITIGAAISFMLIALMLALPAVTGTRSVLQTEGTSSESQASPTPTVQPTVAPSPVASASPAAGAQTAGSPTQK